MEYSLDFNTAPAQADQEIPEWARETGQKLDAQEVKARLHSRLESVLGYLFPAGFAEPKGRVFYIGDARGTRGESLNVQLQGPNAGLWYDFSTGEGGDIFDLWREARGIHDFKAALKDAAEFVGAVETVPRRMPKRKPSAKTCEGTPTHTYQYRDANGTIIAEVDRFEWIREDGTRGKAFRPWDARQRAYRAPEPRPLYALQSIASAPEVVLVEGEKCADALLGCNIDATTAMGGSNAPIEKTDWSPLAGRKVLIWPDNDAPGRKYAEAAAAAIRAAGALSVDILSIPEGRGPKWDAADAVDAGENPRDLIRQMRAEAKSAPEPGSGLTLEPWGTLEDVPTQWLVDGLIPQQSMTALYGRPGSYKSFVALYIALAVSCGMACFGRSAVPGPVVYIMAEGGAGAYRRTRALEAVYGAENPAVAFLRHPLDLRSSVADAVALVNAIETLALKPALVVLDTLARNFGGGNENSSEDMGAFIATVDKLRHRLGCAVIIVHHSGKDEARGMRGHSMLLGAVDTELEVVKISDDDAPDRLGEMTVTKQKDGEDGFKIGYQMREVPLGDGKTSLAVVPVAPEEMPRRKAKLNAYEDAALRDLVALVNTAGRPMTVRVRGAITERRCVPLDDAREHCAKGALGQLLAEIGNPASRRQKLKRTLDALLEKSVIGTDTGNLWINQQ